MVWEDEGFREDTDVSFSGGVLLTLDNLETDNVECSASQTSRYLSVRQLSTQSTRDMQVHGRLMISTYPNIRTRDESDSLL